MKGLFVGLVFVAGRGYAQDHDIPQRELNFPEHTVYGGGGGDRGMDRGGPNRDHGFNGKPASGGPPSNAAPAPVASPLGPPAYRLEQNIVMPAEIVYAVSLMADRYKGSTGLDMRITSGDRTVRSQAVALYQLMHNSPDPSVIVRKYRDHITAQEILAAYQRNPDDEEKAVQEISILLNNTITSGKPFSNHLDHHAIDVGIKELTDEQIKQLIAAATADPNARVILEGPKSDTPRLNRLAGDSPRTTVGPAPDVHLHVSFAAGLQIQMLQPDIIDFPITMEGIGPDRLKPRLDIQQCEIHALDPDPETAWKNNPKPSFSEEFYNVNKLVLHPDTHDWIGEDFRRYHSVGDPYWDPEFKGFVKKLVAQEGGADTIIIPSFGALPIIKQISNSGGTEQIIKWDADWGTNFTYEETLNGETRSFEIANYTE